MSIKKKMNGKNLVVGIGSALVDILVSESDEFLTGISNDKGGMTYVDSAFSGTVLKKTDQEAKLVPGGACCNTIVGIGKLDGNVKFIGKHGNDSLGAIFKKGLEESHVNPQLIVSNTPTGKVLSIITPDAQRSMFTYLGASSEIHPNEIDESVFKDAAIIMVEGYLLFNHELIMSVLESAKKSGGLIAMDLASFTVIRENRSILKRIVKDYVDILIANEDEAFEYTGEQNEIEALKKLSSDVKIGVLKVGKKGSLICESGIIYEINPKGNGYALDTTGAGDLWASGFLYGLVNGYSIKKSGEIGSACGHAVCQVVGASIPDSSWETIKKMYCDE